METINPEIEAAMTPEQIVRGLLEKHRSAFCLVESNPNPDLMADLSQAIREAAEEGARLERQQCALIAESKTIAYPPVNMSPREEGYNRAATQIADEIRARGEDNT